MPIVTELDLLKNRRSKIVATVGPASANRETIAQLIRAGVDVFRINMSHGEHSAHDAAIATIREVSAECGTHTAILADLCGPKIRTGKFQNGSVELIADAKVVVTTRDVIGNSNVIASQYDGLPQDVRSGNRILLNDGAVELKVERVDGTDVHCTVIAGGSLGDHKGINLPGVNVSAPSLTDKDRVDAQFALAQRVDFLALSFVRRASDIESLRAIIDAASWQPMIVAKIEKPEALENASAIIAATDAIMVARGDLGVELNPEQVPVAQDELIKRAIAANKPVIVATQMLESMIENARPTRAEVTDVAHAVGSGTDAVMLSGETAVGAFPVQAVAMMDRIARQTESYNWHTLNSQRSEPSGVDQTTIPFGDAVADAVAKLVGDTRARAVLVISNRGMTAATISAARPKAPVVAISRDEQTCRRMSLMWGVIPHLNQQVGKDNPAVVARGVAKKLQLAEAGEFVVLVRGFHAESELNVPTISLITI
ncbi:MAG: pyruvate kinase [Gammaproteobacteria bacterium]|jgi:pyruvate kinase